MKDDTSRRPAVHALLKDGTTVRIRTVELRDHDQPEGLYTEMSPDNRRLRSFSAGPRSARLAADTVCAPARRGHRALLAERAGQVIGLVEYHADGDAPHTAELAVAVADGLHDRGVGTLLVEHLVSAARADCITSFTADVLSENHEVLRLFAGLGLAAPGGVTVPDARIRLLPRRPQDPYLRRPR
ncbi:N-acetyltransferase family protein [Streptomyces hirsutus]|uniref:GNAT family N-acetyltransferase n=1 Tax=Streptomyces hirsutus TaxID=35620 RepID=UPI003F4CBD0A